MIWVRPDLPPRNGRAETKVGDLFPRAAATLVSQQ